MKKGEPVQNARLSAIMSDICKKYKIPYSINSLCHLFASHCKFALKFSDKRFQPLAEQMGSSLHKLETAYTDYKSKQIDMGELDRVCTKQKKN